MILPVVAVAVVKGVIMLPFHVVVVVVVCGVWEYEESCGVSNIMMKEKDDWVMIKL